MKLIGILIIDFMEYISRYKKIGKDPDHYHFYRVEEIIMLEMHFTEKISKQDFNNIITNFANDKESYSNPNDENDHSDPGHIFLVYEHDGSILISLDCKDILILFEIYFEEYRRSIINLIGSYENPQDVIIRDFDRNYIIEYDGKKFLIISSKKEFFEVYTLK